jgi:hypothetical protein
MPVRIGFIPFSAALLQLVDCSRERMLTMVAIGENSCYVSFRRFVVEWPPGNDRKQHAAVS